MIFAALHKQQCNSGEDYISKSDCIIFLPQIYLHRDEYTIKGM